MTGRIHSFETFGTTDGPGIRFVVFMQGCQYRCLYCHNPDTWSVTAGTEYSPEDLFQIILRYKPYFESSGGGVTISGGEPLLQSEFLFSLFTLLKNEGIHTTLDTSGNQQLIGNPAVEALIGLTDLVLLDIKHMESLAHKRLTGYDNTLPLHFAKDLDYLKLPVWLRYVIVPGYTDSPDALMTFREFINSLSNVARIDYLPFHKLGEYKWEALGIPWPLKHVSPPSEEFIKGLSAHPI